MANMDGRTRSGQAGRSTWRTPELRELGNLSDFVRSGNAFGKSGAPADGSSSGNDESMPMN